MIAVLRITLSGKWKWIFNKCQIPTWKNSIDTVSNEHHHTTTTTIATSKSQKLQVGKWLLNKDACTGPGKVLQPIKKDAETGRNMSDPSQKILAMKVSPQTQLTGHHCWRKPRVILAWRHYVQFMQTKDHHCPSNVSTIGLSDLWSVKAKSKSRPAFTKIKLDRKSVV